eukprot:c4002_g1_i1.p1 GENE.c4002_g1_i1~~c4002_g1_i1.p1  ORF type:complete len:527 (-),score=100.64 c4002_g1_i1:100-1638(-)
MKRSHPETTTGSMRQFYGHFINGEEVPSLGGEEFDVENPAKGTVLCRVAAGKEQDVERAVNAAHESFRSGVWSNMHPRDRARILNKAAEILRSRISLLAEIESLSTGRAIREMNAQLGRVPEWLEYFAALGVGAEGSVTPALGPFFNYVRRVPLGVVAQITPWNHPLLIATKKVAPALAAGNSIVLKPSELAPVAVLELARALTDAGLPKGVINVVNGMGPDTGKFLCEHALVRKVDLTGGTVTGRAVCAAAGRNLKKVTAELGGKAPVIVFEDADIERAVRGVAFAAFVASGQTCISASRLIVHDSIKDRFVEALVAKTMAIELGDPIDPQTQLGSVASQRQFDHVSSLVESARSEGLTILCGGGPPSNLPESCANGYFFAPTVIDNVAPTNRIFQEEVFGPVITVTGFSTEAEAIALANNCEFGLGAAVWTQNVARAHRVVHQIEAGIVWVNDHHKNDPSLPWGGFKNSGMGKENGWECLYEYMDSQTVMVNLSDETSDWFSRQSGTRYN